MKKLLLVSKFQEDVSWLSGVKIPFLVVDKSSSPISGSINRPNVGREAETLSWFIIENYNNLPDLLIFVQGNPTSDGYFSYEECVEKINTVSSLELKGFLTRRDEVIDIENFWIKKLPLLYKKIFKKYKKRIKFSLGAQFIIPKKNILSKPLSFYQEIHKQILKFKSQLNAERLDLTCGIDPWSMEGLWYEIFDEDNEVNTNFSSLLNNDFKLGLFYQSGYRIEACYFALNQFRKFYPDAPVALYEDNTRILKPVAKKFGCDYKVTDVNGRNDPTSGRPAYDLKTILAWINRVYEACVTTLKDVDYVMNFEDDVWFKSFFHTLPPYDLSGIPGRGAHKGLYEHLKSRKQATFGCGGSVFNREKFLIAYEKSKLIDWDLIDRLATNNDLSTHQYPRPSMWTDSALTLIFLNANMSVGHWKEVDSYINKNVAGANDRSTWPGSMESLEKEQHPWVNVIHCWKPYYFPTEEEKNYVNQELSLYRTPIFL